MKFVKTIHMFFWNMLTLKPVRDRVFRKKIKKLDVSMYKVCLICNIGYSKRQLRKEYIKIFGKKYEKDISGMEIPYLGRKYARFAEEFDIFKVNVSCSSDNIDTLFDEHQYLKKIDSEVYRSLFPIFPRIEVCVSNDTFEKLEKSKAFIISNSKDYTYQIQREIIAHCRKECFINRVNQHLADHGLKEGECPNCDSDLLFYNLNTKLYSNFDGDIDCGSCFTSIEETFEEYDTEAVLEAVESDIRLISEEIGYEEKLDNDF